MFRPTRCKIELGLFPNERDGCRLVVAGLKQHVVKLVFVAAAVGARKVKRIGCIRACTKPTAGVRSQCRVDVFARQGLFTPFEHVTVAVEQNVRLQGIAAVLVGEGQFRNAGGHRNGPLAGELSEQRQRRGFVARRLKGDLKVRADRSVHRLFVHQRAGVALYGGEGHDGERQEHDDGQPIDRLGRTRTLEAALHVLEQGRATEDHLHDLRPFGTDSTQQQGTADPQRKGPKDADETFDEEVGNQTVLAAVGLEPGITHGEHTKQEGQPVQPSLGLGGGRGLSNAFFNFKLNELTGPTATEEQRQPERGDGGEQR